MDNICRAFSVPKRAKPLYWRAKRRVDIGVHRLDLTKTAKSLLTTLKITFAWCKHTPAQSCNQTKQHIYYAITNKKSGQKNCYISYSINTLRSIQNDRHPADEVLKFIFILIQISLPKLLVAELNWLTHICVTRLSDFNSHARLTEVALVTASLMRLC